MATRSDARQIISRDFLDQVLATAPGPTGKELDDVLRSINEELTPPFRMMPSNPNDLVITVENINVINPETSRNRTIPPINNLLPTFTSATVTLGGTGAGNATPSVGSALALGMSASQFMRIGINIDALGSITLTKGTPGASLAAATTPPTVSGLFWVGHFVARTNGSNVTQVIRNQDTYQYVGGGGGGGGAGDTTEIVETIKNMLNDSFYGLAAHSVFQTDEEDMVDPASTGDYSLVTKIFELGTGETLLTNSLLDQEEFLDLGRDVSKVDISLFWNLGLIDDAATVEVTRDGGAHWTEVELDRVGEASATFHGSHEFEEEQDAYSDSFATTTNTLDLTNAAGVRESLAQRFALTEETEVTSVTIQMSKASSPAGQYRVLLTTSNSSQPNTSNVVAASAWTNTSTLGTSAGPVVLSVAKILQAATYHVVVETDAAYKAGTGSGTIRMHGVTSGGDGSASALDASVWAAISVTKFAYSVVGFIESFDMIVQQASTDVNRDLNITTQQRISQSFVLTDTNVIKEVTLFLTKTGSPAGRAYVSIVRNNAGSPSTDPNDVLIGATGVDISALATGANRIQLPVTPIVAGTYHLVIQANSAYNYVNGVTEISFHALDAGTGMQFYNGTVWSSASDALKYTLSGRPLEMLLRVTASQTSALEGFSVYYDTISAKVSTGSKNLEIHQFNSDANENEFTLTTFTPDPDALNVFYVQSGQVFRFGAFELQGNTVVFPEGSFDNGGVSAAITLVFTQSEGSGFDNSDINARLLADSYLGSTDASLDRSQPGRGFKLRRPDGVLRELRLNNSDEWEVWSVD